LYGVTGIILTKLAGTAKGGGIRRRDFFSRESALPSASSAGRADQRHGPFDAEEYANFSFGLNSWTETHSLYGTALALAAKAPACQAPLRWWAAS